MDSKIEQILEYISDRSGEIYDEMQEPGLSEEAFSFMAEQVAILDEVYQKVVSIGASDE